MNTKTPRFVLNLKNNDDNDPKGDFLLITEGKAIHKYYWIKEKEKQKFEDEK